MVGVSLDCTSQVGTYFYTASKIDEGWPRINEEVAMHNFKVVFLEVWQPFGIAMEICKDNMLQV